MDHTLTDHRLAILSKAAPRGHAHAGTVEDWQAGIDRLVKRAQRPGEDHATAYARVTATGDGRAFLDCLRKAEDGEAAERRGRPRKYQPGEVVRSRIEAALSDAALKLAAANGTSFESAFARVLQTPAGSDLYTALRAAAPDSGE
jgi:hypothetical protein